MKNKIVNTLPKKNGVNPLKIIMAKSGNLNGENLKDFLMNMEEQLWFVLNAAAGVSYVNEASVAFGWGGALF